MASKASKKSAAAAAAAATPVTSSAASSAQSPMTPTRLSRIQEKNTLASLNDRLAAIIDRNQQLESENASMGKQLTSIEEHHKSQVKRVSNSYEKELNEARRLVDETAKDKAKLVFNHDQLKLEFGEIKTKLDKKTKEANNLNKQVSSLENQLEALQNSSTRANSEKDKLLAEKKELEDELGRLNRDYDNLRKQLEVESSRRIDAENKYKSKQDEFNFKLSQNEEMIEEMRSKRSIEIQEVGGQLQQEYDQKLQQSVQELRAEYETQLRANKAELDGLYEQKVADLKAQLKRYLSSAASKADEIGELNARLESLTASFSRIESERNGLSEKVKALNKKLDEDQSRFVKILMDRDHDIDVLCSEKTALMNEYQELMDTKVGLDNELAMYRKLLEGEERRLSLSPRHSLRVEETPGGRRTPLRGGLKRKRVAIEEFDEASTSYQTEATQSGDIVVEEDDPEGKFVKLFNKGEKEVSLSGWQLVRRSGDNETTHKFHRSVKLDKGGVATIYSSDVQGVTNEPPSTIVMKGQKWFAGDLIATYLLNNAGEEVARRETRKVHHASQRRRVGFGEPEELFHQEPDGSQPDRCVIC